MATDREERFLMRQRGAGTRQVQDVSFHLALPGVATAPLRSQRSGRSRETPQRELAPQRSSRKTPKSTQQLRPQPSSRRTAGTLRKRLKPTEQLPPQPPPLRTPGTSRNRLPERPSPYDIPRTEDKAHLPSSQPGQRDEQGLVTKRMRLTASVTADGPPLSLSRSAISTTQVNSPTTELDNIEEDALNAPKASEGSGEKKRKKRISIGQVSRKRARPSPGQTVASSGNPVATLESTPIEQAQPFTSNSNVTAQEPSATPQEHQSASKPKRRKRKSIGVLPKIRIKSTVTAQKSVPTVEPSSSRANDAAEYQESPQVNSARGRGRPRKSLPIVEEDQDEEVAHLENATGLAKSKSRGRPRKSFPIVDEDQDEEVQHLESTTELAKSKPRARPRKSDLTMEVIEETQPKVLASKAPTKPSNSKPRHFRATSDISESAVRRSRTRKESIPITVHRLSRVQALVYEDDDQDILAGPAPFPKKGGVNAIDVLSQICREMIAKTMDTLQRGAKNEGHEGRKAEWKRKRKAVEMFGDELDGRLFQMTEALDNNFALSIRLKHANKEKMALREELLSLRRERENIALRADEVRKSHAKASKAAQDDNDLNRVLHDIELAVQRGRAQQESGSDDGNDGRNGLEVLMQDVAATVSSAKGPGLLGRVKDFNGFLERAVSAVNVRA